MPAPDLFHLALIVSCFLLGGTLLYLALSAAWYVSESSGKPSGPPPAIKIRQNVARRLLYICLGLSFVAMVGQLIFICLALRYYSNDVTVIWAKSLRGNGKVLVGTYVALDVMFCSFGVMLFLYAKHRPAAKLWPLFLFFFVLNVILGFYPYRELMPQRIYLDSLAAQNPVANTVAFVSALLYLLSIIIGGVVVRKAFPGPGQSDLVDESEGELDHRHFREE